MSQLNKNGKHGAKYGTEEKETKKFFGRISFRAFALSLVALIQIALLLVGATYSWVETISSIKFDGATGQIGTGVKKIVNLNDEKKEVSLDDYFEQVGGDTHLAACSSADAENFYFPIVGEGITGYRLGTINDKNVNYVDFDFQINNTTNLEKSFRFQGVPNVPDNVRIAICADNEPPKIFANVDKTTTKTVVYSRKGDKKEITVEPFNKYTATNNNQTIDDTIFKIAGNRTATVYVKLWLDINSPTESTGDDITINNFKIVSRTSQKKISVALGNGVKGGSVNIDGTGDKSSIIANYGDTVKLVATANDLTYEFTGWYDNAECTGTPVSRNATYSITVGDDTSAKYYAKFENVIVVHLKNSCNWTDLHIHYLGGASVTTWPGEPCIEESGNNNCYTYNIPGDSTEFIFNNNDKGSQTVAISVKDMNKNNNYYDNRMGGWSKKPEDNTHRIIVSIENNNNSWDNGVYCHAWNSVGNNLTHDVGKFGKSMNYYGIKDGHKVYYIDIDKKYTDVIFTNGNSGGDNQTKDVNVGNKDASYRICEDQDTDNKYKLSEWK